MNLISILNEPESSIQFGENNPIIPNDNFIEIVENIDHEEDLQSLAIVSRTIYSAVVKYMNLSQ